MDSETVPLWMTWILTYGTVGCLVLIWYAKTARRKQIMKYSLLMTVILWSIWPVSLFVFFADYRRYDNQYVEVSISTLVFRVYRPSFSVAVGGLYEILDGLIAIATLGMFRTTIAWSHHVNQALKRASAKSRKE